MCIMDIIRSNIEQTNKEDKIMKAQRKMPEWLEDEMRMRLRNYVPSDREDEVNDKLWTVKEVMFYYGKWIESEEVAVDIMKEVKKRTPAKWRNNTSQRMNLVRDLLRYEWGIDGIPATVRYRRLK